jgi:hypothetical protein
VNGETLSDGPRFLPDTCSGATASLAEGTWMFKSRFIRDSRGSMVGRMVEDNSGSRAYDVRGSYVGRYDRKFDHTCDNAGRLITISGDALPAPLFGRRR